MGILSKKPLGLLGKKGKEEGDGEATKSAKKRGFQFVHKSAKKTTQDTVVDEPKRNGEAGESVDTVEEFTTDDPQDVQDDSPKRRKTIHRRLKAPGYPSAEIRTAVEEARIEFDRKNPVGGLKNLMENILTNQKEICNDVFTDHFVFVSKAIGEICDLFTEHMNSNNCKPLNKFQRRLNKEVFQTNFSSALHLVYF